MNPDEVIETAETISASSMSAFVEMVIRFFENPEHQRRFEEWKKQQAAAPALITATAGNGAGTISARPTKACTETAR